MNNPLPDPPAHLMAGVGPPNQFRSCGLEFFGHFKSLVGLKDHQRILDVGCGPGRMAIPLAESMPGLAYDGFDVSKPCIDWCRSVITPTYPEFRFQWVDVQNGTYYATGQQNPSSFRFPYADKTFDLVIMVSVLTHLQISAARNYLIETERVLKAEGRLFATVFLIDERAIMNIQSGRASLKFRPHEPLFWTINPRSPEDAVAFEQDLLMRLLSDARLAMDSSIRRGKWDGGPGFSGHDILVAKKSG